MADLRGRFLWHELLTTDTGAAQPFYTRVVGWRVEAWQDNPSYLMWIAGSGPVGGLMTLPREAGTMGAPPNWLTYIGTPNVDATVSQATQRGARVLKAAETMDRVGRFAVLADPQGAVFALFTPQTPRAWSTPQLGEFSWHELATTDPDGAFGFYSALFGWEKTDAMDMGPGLGVYQMYGLGGAPMGGIYRKPADMPAPPNWLPYALVPNADQAADRARAAGGQILNGPMDVPGGDRIAVIMDAQGAAFAVHSRGAAHPAAAPRPKAAKRPPKPKSGARKPARKRPARKKKSPTRRPRRTGRRKPR
jgi:predicted enzyme related to lactoylglutathione lyase